MILHIREARVCGPHSLRLTFDDGITKQVHVLPLLDGPIYEPLRDPTYFARMTLDPICGTVVWPNGADFAPEALRDLEDDVMAESVILPFVHSSCKSSRNDRSERVAVTGRRSRRWMLRAPGRR
jgi:hypothetical protein